MIETMLLNLFFQREISTMLPRQEVFGGNLEIVRPFYDTREKDIICYLRHADIPVSGWKCSLEDESSRAWIQKQLRTWQKAFPKQYISKNLFRAMQNVNPDFFPKEVKDPHSKCCA